jgi:hypothetical protein
MKWLLYIHETSHNSVSEQLLLEHLFFMPITLINVIFFLFEYFLCLITHEKSFITTYLLGFPCELMNTLINK